MEPLRLGEMAKGGACVARLVGDDGGAGRIVFVRDGLPGETVRIEVTDTSRASWWRGRVVEVLEPSPDRVEPVCPNAGRCGGCDWQHIALQAQRQFKAGLVGGQMLRLAGQDATVTVAAMKDDAGLGWRTRMRYLADGAAVGLRAPFSHDMVPLPAAGCPLAAPGGPTPPELVVLAGDSPEVGVTVADSGVTVWRPARGVVSGEAVVEQRVHGRGFEVRADGFWQVHPDAAGSLVDAVMDVLQPRAGEHAADLYCGVGLFAGALVDAGATVRGVEADRAAVRLARRNVPGAEFLQGRVERTDWARPGRVDLVVLDPPRAGAGRPVVDAVSGAAPRAVAYVACDEASLARDVAYFAARGYALTSLRAFDIFPMTAHVECVAGFARS